MKNGNTISQGDYVLATKYHDGDPRDPFVVGFFIEVYRDRFIVADSEGKSFRITGFRRCEKISGRVGNALVAAMSVIGNVVGPSVWYWRYHPDALDRLRAMKGGE
jgi:hypothetical protein